MSQPLFSFVFPYGKKGEEIRCVRGFADALQAANWAVDIILKHGEDYCYFKRVQSRDCAFEPACEPHTVVHWHDDAPTWEMYHVID